MGVEKTIVPGEAMPDKRYTECKRFVMRGLLALAGGSVLLLMPKLFGVPEFLAAPSLFAGCSTLLYGNGCIIYGLLIHAGNSEPL